MRSLRYRIALLLIVSIVGVVGLATVAVVTVMRGPKPGPAMIPIAHQVRLLAQVAPGHQPSPDDISLDLRARRADGTIDEGATYALNDTLRREGSSLQAIVTKNDRPRRMTVSIRLPEDRWMIVDLPDFGPPPDGWIILSGWITLIVLGATAVSFYFATMLVRPLEMLEASVSQVGADGLLLRLPEEGSGEVVATARALNNLSARLRSAMESRMRLVAAAGHDLRTPMTRMRLRAEFLDDEEREKWLNDLDELDRIADSAIRLVREEVASDPPEPVRLDGLVHDLVAEIGSLGLPVSEGRMDEVTVRGGSLGLRRALRNLIVNGATHGKGCVVDLAAEGDKATIVIADRGPGIPDELIAKAFEPFFRVDPARRQSIPGAGLGLAIAKEIAERWGGTVSLRNRPGGGLEQTVTFPVS